MISRKSKMFYTVDFHKLMSLPEGTIFMGGVSTPYA